MMNPHRPVYWYQGLFLQPQHLQQLDLYHESMLMPLKNYLNPYFWGVCQLEVDQGSLKELKFDLISGEFIFRDGTWISIHHNAILEPRSFKQLWEKLREPFTVYLALKQLSNSNEEVDKYNQKEDGSGILPKSRFILDSENNEVNDLYNHTHTASVDSLKYVLKLVWDKEVDYYPEYELIPIARVEYNGQDPLCSKEFAPPIINLVNSPVLYSYLRNTKEMLYARSITLSSYKSLRKSLGGEYQPTSLLFLLGLKTISHFVPLLNHFVESPNVSPWVLYGVFRQLLGELSMINENIDALGLSPRGELLIPPYDHTNLGYCFKQVCVLIDEIVDGLVSSMESIVHLVRDGNYFAGNIPVDLLKDTNNFYLCIKSNLDSSELSRIIYNSAKIGSSEDVPILIKRALSGVPITGLKEPPVGLAHKKNITYFILDHHHFSWLSVKEYANLSVFLGEPLENIEIDLLVLKGRDLLT